MSDDRPVFVLALAGLTPAVVTELLWHLVVRETRKVVGLEIWTTADATGKSGARALGDRYHWFHELRTEVGAAATLLPDFPIELQVVDPPDGWNDEPFRVVVPRRANGDHVDDIATTDDAELYGERLHDRLRSLRGHLPTGVVLLGALAGGRKTMTAALQTAFSLQAPAPARLVHVLVHRLIEQDHPLLKTFAFPREGLKKLPVNEQVTVYDVPFVPLREFGSSLEADLDVLPFRELQTLMRHAALGKPSVRVFEDRDGTFVELLRGGTSVDCRYSIEPAFGEAYRMVLDASDGVHTIDLQRALERKGQDASTARWLNRQTEAILEADTVARVMAPFLPSRSGDARDKRWRIASPEGVRWDIPAVSKTPLTEGRSSR